jgi:DNA-binding LacI/PurR family transcriptional regulator
MAKLTQQQVLQVAGEAAVDPRTVKRIYAGEKSPKLVRERVEAAAKKLKLVAPPSSVE